MTTSPQPSSTADRELKAKHRTHVGARATTRASRARWSRDLGPILVEASGISRGDRVLDIAAGSGNASIPAAADRRRGRRQRPHSRAARGRPRRRRATGLPITWQEADAEALPFEDASFDAVISCLGVMFAPHHQVAADELLRVCRRERPHRPAQLDAGGLHRADVRDHEALRAAAPAGCAAASAVGLRGPRA